MKLPFVALASLHASSSSSSAWESNRFCNDGLGHINHHLNDGACSLLVGNVSEDKAPFQAVVGRAFGDDEGGFKSTHQSGGGNSGVLTNSVGSHQGTMMPMQAIFGGVDDGNSSAGGNDGGGGGLEVVTALTQDHLGGFYGHRGSAMVDVAVEEGGISGDTYGSEGYWGVLGLAKEVGSGVVAKSNALQVGSEWGNAGWKGDSGSGVEESVVAGREDVLDIRDFSGRNSGVFAVVSWQDLVQDLAVSRRDGVVSLEESGNGNISGFKDGDEFNVQDSVLVDQVDPSINDKRESDWENFLVAFAVLILVMIMTAVSCLTYPRFVFMPAVSSSTSRGIYDRGYKTLRVALLKLSLIYPMSNHSGGKRSRRKGRGPNNWSPRYLVLCLSCFLMMTVNGTRASALRGGYKDPSEQVFPLYEGLSSAPRYLQEKSSEPFTIASLDPSVILDALDTAKAAVTEYIADEVNETFAPLKDEITALVGDISTDSIKEIRNKLIECFEGLDDENLNRLENITSFISDFSPDTAVEKLLSPDEEGSCSPPDVNLTELTGLPDISSSANEARAFSLNLVDCIADTVNNVDLGPISALIKPIDRRKLQEAEWGLTLGLGASIDISKTLTIRNIDFTGSITLAGLGVETGFDSGANSPFGVGFSFAPVSLSLSATITTTTCDRDPASNTYSVEPGYYCQVNPLIPTVKTICPAGEYCLGGKDEPDGNCEPGYYCPEGSTSPLGRPVDSFKFTDENGKYKACAVDRVCRCEAGYWCPNGSTTPRGRPIINYPETTESPTSSPSKSPSTSPSKSPSTSPSKSPSKAPSTSPTTSPSKSPTTSPSKSPTSSPTSSPSKSPSQSPVISSRLLITDEASKHRRLPVVPFTCNRGTICKCPVGYYCQANSDLPKPCDAPAATTCPQQRCVDKTSCTAPAVPNRGKKTFLTKLTDFLGGTLEAEFSAGVSIQAYTQGDIFGGGSGFGLDIDLPFNWLPTISLLFDAPPLHCLFESFDNDGNPTYEFAGIGLSTPLSGSVPIRNNAATEEEKVRDAAAIVNAGIDAESTRFKDRLKKFIQDVKEDKKFPLSNSVGFGFGYSYDWGSATNPAEAYDWSKVCGDATSSPTTSPSSRPSTLPSTTTSPSLEPSLSSRPTTTTSPSLEPSLSSRPSTTTSPSLDPSSSTNPTMSPTTLPSLTMSPTTLPSLKPSSSSVRRRIQDNSLSVVELPKQSRALQKPATEQVTEVISILVSAFGSGDLPFCVGKCDDTPRDSSKVIQGVFTSRFTSECDGVRLSALVSDAITVNTVLYLTLNQISEDVADETIDFLSSIKLGEFGIENVELVLEVDAFPSIELSLSGDPALPAIDRVNTDTTSLFFYDLFDGLKFGITSRISPNGASLELSASTVPQIDPNDNGFAIVDANGNGFAIFFYYEVLPLRVVGGVSRTQIVQFGLRLPMRICVQDCDGSNPEIFYLQGEVSVSQVVAPGTVPATLLGGQLELVGVWNNPFGLPILNVLNVVAGAEFDLSKAVGTGIPPPSSLTLGATVCLGSSDACNNPVPANKNYIIGAAYIGINTAVKEKNFFFGLISSFTIENILRVANELDDANLDSLITGLPASVLESGITPVNASDPACGPVNTTALATGEEQLILDCFAWVAISPFGENEIESINLSIPKGIGFSGRLKLFDLFEVEAEAQIDVIDTATPSFFLDAKLELTLDNFLYIGENLTTDNSGVEGAARVLIDYKSGQSVLVDIQAAFAIPILRSYGEVTIIVNDDGALLEGQIQFLELLKPTVMIKWDWAFNNFYGEFGNIVFAPGFELKKLILDVETKPTFILFFKIDITVLSFANLGASLLMEEKNNGQDLFVNFTLVADLALIKTTVRGDATLDLMKIENTDFGSFDVSASPGNAAKAVAKFVEGAVTAIADGITKTVNAVAEAIQVIGEAILTIIDSLDFIADAFEAAGASLVQGVDALISGDPEALATAGENFAAAFDSLVSPENWEDVGNAIVEGLEDVGLAITNAIGLSTQSETRNVFTLPQKDQWGCYYIRTDVTTRTCWTIFFVQYCEDSTKQGPKESNATCVEEPLTLLVETRAKAEQAGTIGTGSKVTMEGNAAILNKARGPIPEATFDDIEGSVPYSKNCSSVLLQSKITGSTKILDNNAAGGISNSDELFETGIIDLDFTPPSCSGSARRLNADGSSTSQAYLDSVSEGIEKLKLQVNQTVNKNMTGINPRIKAYQPEVELIKLTIGFSNNPNDQVVAITCSELPGLATSKRPRILTSDPDCKTTVIYTKFSETVDVPSQYPCGTVELTRRWNVSDTCGQSDYIDQLIYLKPRPPIWPDNPWSEAVFTFSTSAETFSPAASNSWPTAKSECGIPVGYSSDGDQESAEEVAGECGLWLMKRTWEASLDINYSPLNETCATNGNPEPPTSTIDQLFYVKDDEAPSVTEGIPSEVRIPFFDNYNSDRLNALLIKDIATNQQAQGLGLTVGDVTLTSEDTDIVFSHTNLNDQSTCRDDGIAHFWRTWTASDKCGNKDTFTQKIILEHPPEVETSTASLEDGIYSFSPGVIQSTDACIPGKQVSNEPKIFEADFNFTITSNVCSEGEAWDQNGCRLLTLLDDPVEVLSVAPEYTSFPSDVTVLTNQSISADEDGTGRPTGEAFCNTPFEIVHEDEAAVLISCGVWKIKRHWTIRPVYLECDVVTDPRLVTERIQIITVKDIFPPQFITLPDTDVDVPFLVDYGPGNAKVGFPIVQEQIESETLRAHAQEFNTEDNFLFVSYQTTLSFVDAVSYQQTREDVCETRSLATVTRTWTTMDRCGQSDTWVQTISITPPVQKLFGDASGYQVASPNGYVQLRKSNFSHPIMSQGNKFGLWGSTVYSSERLANSIDIDDSSAVSIVLDSCPTNSLEQEFLPDGDLLYIGGGKKKCTTTQKLNSVVELDADTSPVNFESAVLSIQSISDTISEGPEDLLLTGPQTINCTTPDVPTSCDYLMMASIEPIQVSPEVSGNELILTKNPLSFVYNLFNVDMNNWFYNTELFQTVQEVRVEAEGFVFVNVLDNVDVTELSNGDYNISRAWSDTLESSQVCDVSSANSQSMPILGNYNSSSDVTLTYGLREVITGDYAQDPSTHLLINLRTNIELIQSGDGVTLADVAPCSGLRYQFSKHEEASIAKGSYLLPNQMSSFEMWNYEMNGQLITNGAQVDMRTVATPPTSLYFPDESSFCPPTQDPLPWE